MSDQGHVPPAGGTDAARNRPSVRPELHFGDRIVRCFADRPHSVNDMLVAAVARNPDGEALVSTHERVTWRKLYEHVACCAGGLTELGVRPGDRVALLLGNRSEFVVLTCAVSMVGAILVPISTREQTPGLAYMLGHCGAKVLIHDVEFTERLPASGELASLRHRVVVGDGPGLTFGQLMRSAPMANPVPVAEDEPVAILYTSGTTGRPKGAVLTHLGVVHSAMHYENAMSLSARDRCAAMVPLTHVTGLVALILTMVRCAGTLVVAEAFKAGEFLKLAARERISYTLMVPAMYNLCLLQPDLLRHDLSAWRVGAFGGAPMPEATIDSLAHAIPGLSLMNVYGATETTSPATLLPFEQIGVRGASVGLALPCADVLVMDEHGVEAPRGEAGEIWIGGPMLVAGYWNDPQATKQAITGGYWHSGDVGWMDSEGYVYVSDRKKDMLNRGGLKIYSIEVEGVLASHPDVVEAAVVGKPCPVLGERVHAFIFAGRTRGLEAELRALCVRSLSDYKVPESFTLLDEPLPRNANGKILKRVLRALLLAEVEGTQLDPTRGARAVVGPS